MGVNAVHGESCVCVCVCRGEGPDGTAVRPCQCCMLSDGVSAPWQLYGKVRVLFAAVDWCPSIP